MGDLGGLKDELARILNEDPYAEVRDHCALAGAVNFNTASKHAIHLGWAQNHRGSDGFGASSIDDGAFHSHKRFGTFSENISPQFDYAQQLPGNASITHARYPTSGTARNFASLQPLSTAESLMGPYVYAHNGQLVVYDAREELLKKGAAFAAQSDTAILPHIMGETGSTDIREGIAHFMQRIETAYSMLLQTPSHTIAFRDRYGVKPLHYAKMEDGWLIASENDAFRTMMDAEYIGAVKPGEIILFEHGVSNEIQPERIQAVSGAPYMPCIFERIYFSNPRSTEEQVMHEDFRYACGAQVVEENKELFDFLKGNNATIVPILDSGKHGALGIAEASGLRQREYFMRRHNAPNVNGRAYTLATEELRMRLAFAKLDLRKEKIAGKWIVTIDDSLVRSTTAKIFNARLNEAGAAGIVNILVSPQVRDICYLGMNHQDASKLAAVKYKTNEALARHVGSDQVIYLSTNGLVQVAKQKYGLETFCGGCFGLEYPGKRPR